MLGTGNLLSQLSAAFSCESRPVSHEEFLEFWDSLSADEQHYYQYDAFLYY